jgi:hypothetical protein
MLRTQIRRSIPDRKYEFPHLSVHGTCGAHCATNDGGICTPTENEEK